jgi:hypothetical protein
MLIAEELALVAIRPGSGRHKMGLRGPLNACLAGLLVGELVLEGVVEQAEGGKGIIVVQGGPVPSSPTLAAAAEVVAKRGPKIRPVLSHMSVGLRQRVGMGTWEAVVSGLGRHSSLDQGTRDAAVARLRAVAAGDEPIDARTALVLSMTGPAQLLELVAPDRTGRKHARERIDHALDGSVLEPLGYAVRRVIRDAAAAAA